MPALLLVQEGEFTPFSINTGLIFWTLVVFGVLLALLWRLGWPALLKAVEERERRIQQQLEEAERARAEAARPLGEHKRTMGGGRGEERHCRSQLRPGAVPRGRGARHGRHRALRPAAGGGGGRGAGRRADRGGARLAARLQGHEGGAAGACARRPGAGGVRAVSPGRGAAGPAGAGRRDRAAV